jgi:hypothetical protein
MNGIVIHSIALFKDLSIRSELLPDGLGELCFPGQYADPETGLHHRHHHDPPHRPLPHPPMHSAWPSNWRLSSFQSMYPYEEG